MADIAEEYRSSLSELNFNSKPHINMLTMLAEENSQHASLIVQAIVNHINSVTPDVKLPSLYLVDSIVKNIGKVYVSLFSKHLVSLFTSVFEKVDENVRSLLYKLRSTWTDIFPNAVLLQLDKTVVSLDPAWPILAQPTHKTIHVNPKFLDKPAVQMPKESEPVVTKQLALLKEVEMKKKQLALLQVLKQKKEQLQELKLRAGLTPSVVESVKLNAKKPINARDPRLSKKLAAASVGSDSTVLQSVVVVPKGIDKKNDRDSPSSKKMKLDEGFSDAKRHVKNKQSSDEVEDNKKPNTDNNANRQNMTSPKHNKGKKRPAPDNAAEFHADTNKSNKKPLLNLESKTNAEGKPLHSFGFDKLENSHQFKSHSHFSSEVTASNENNLHYKLQPNVMADSYDKSIRKLEPPPPPPLFLGTEDKDYRILNKNVDPRPLNESTYPKCTTLPVVKSFKLDDKERKVYFVNDRCFAVLDNIPRELTFEGPPKLVYIEGFPQPMELGFGGHQVKFETDGKCNFIKFGTPSREVYINDHPYEAQFGGSPFTAVLANDKVHRIQISGPPPKVILSNAPAHELYEKFCMNNQEFLSRFDNKPTLNNDISSQVPVTAHDVDMRVIHDRKVTSFNFPLEKMNNVNWHKVHVGNSQQPEWNVPKNSFETLKDVKSNFVTHRNFSEGPEWNRSQEMQNSSMNPPPLPPKQMINRFPGMPPPPQPPASFRPNYSGVNPPLLHFPPNELPRNMPPLGAMAPPESIPPRAMLPPGAMPPPRAMPPNSAPFPHPICTSAEYAAAPDMNKMNVSIIRRLSPPPLPPFLVSVPNPSCMTVPTCAPYSNTTVSAPMPHTSAQLLSMPPPPLLPRLAAPMPMTNLVGSISMPSFTVPGSVPSYTAEQTPTSTTSASSGAGPVNMDLFLEKLVAAGLIGKNSSTAVVESEEDVKEETPKPEAIPEITFNSKSLKEFHSGVIAAVYCGSQCATCGMRFKEIQSEQYSQHLDWHFRRNRREKDGVKKPFSRRWYYEIKDWIEFKEFEDVDERAPSYFELQANVDQPEEVVPENVSSVPCSECVSEKCAVCNEQFQQFWVEEEEEWHLRNAIIHDNEVYHPACLEDFKKANDPTLPKPDTSLDESVAEIKSDAELDSDIKVKIEDVGNEVDMEEAEMNVDVKEETEMDVDMKKDIKLEVEEKDVKFKVGAKQPDSEAVAKILTNVVGGKEDKKLDAVKEKKIVGKKENLEKAAHNLKKGVERSLNAKKNVKETDLNVEKNAEKESLVVEVNDEANLDVGSVSEEPSLLVEKVNDKANLNVGLVSKEASLDVGTIGEEASIDVGVNKEANLDAGTVSEVVSFDVETVSQVASLDVGAVSEVASLDVGIVTEVNMDLGTVTKETNFIVEQDNEETSLHLEKDEELEHDINKDAKQLDLDIRKEAKELNPCLNKDAKELNPGIKKDAKNLEQDANATAELAHKEKTVGEPTVSNIVSDENDKIKSNLVAPELVIKVEPMDIEEGGCDKSGKEKSETNILLKSSDVKSVKLNKVDEQSQSSSQVPTKLEDVHEDIEFRPPTPDPRFQVLPPVSKGTEISNLCTIM